MHPRQKWILLSLAIFATNCAKPATPPASEPKSAAPQRTEQPIPADLRIHIERAESIGISIFLADQASALGTDALNEHVASPKGLGGYVTMPEGEKLAYEVAFFTDEKLPRIAYRIHVSLRSGAKPTFDALQPPQRATDMELSLIRAREAALAAVPEITQPLNPVIVPGEFIGEEGLLVYLLAGTTEPHVSVIGKHFRVLVSEDGRTVKRFEPLSKVAMEFRWEPGATPKQINMSHILHDYPLETHVFASLLYRIPVGVLTARGLWLVERDHIFFLGAK
jgi:hypothetical protein